MAAPPFGNLIKVGWEFPKNIPPIFPVVIIGRGMGKLHGEIDTRRWGENIPAGASAPVGILTRLTLAGSFPRIAFFRVFRGTNFSGAVSGIFIIVL
jgi:hypothetical protein